MIDEYVIYCEIFDNIPLSDISILSKMHNKLVKNRIWDIYERLYNDMVDKKLKPQFNLEKDMKLMFPSMMINIVKALMKDIHVYFMSGEWSKENDFTNFEQYEEEELIISYSWFGYNPLTMVPNIIQPHIYNKLMEDSKVLREVHNEIYGLSHRRKW
jgi:hypothetical protein|tara:strand:- start:990 stop:1460 length:471 start_codon:yes stop_codon:yes gene_type:complete